jgi:hypothetical protein
MAEPSSRNRRPRANGADRSSAAQHEVPHMYEARMEAAIVAEEASARRWGFGRVERSFTALAEGGPFMWLILAISLAVVFVFGRYGPSLQQEMDQGQIIARALATAVPVVSALEVSVDPGKYTGKLMDVVMQVNNGGVSKSGKSIYLQETQAGMALVIFESAFESFGGVNEIAPRFIGKTVRARGTIRQFQDRVSLAVFAPGLISEIPHPVK